MLDEGETALELLEACRAAALPIGPFEICVTDDGSRDDDRRGAGASPPPIPICP
jgi:hypothetical protein